MTVLVRFCRGGFIQALCLHLLVYDENKYPKRTYTKYFHSRKSYCALEMSAMSEDPSSVRQHHVDYDTALLDHLEEERKKRNEYRMYTSDEGLMEYAASRPEDPFRLLSGKWLLAQIDATEAEGAPLLHTRQELEAESPGAFADVSSFRDIKSQVVAISYPWLTPTHPDPHGFHMKRIGVYLRKWFIADAASYEYGDLGLFWDYSSLYQRPRTDEQQRLFLDGLGRMGVLYAHSYCQVLKLTELPEGFGGPGYQDRGWTTFESCVSSLNKRQLYDLGKLTDLESEIEYFELFRSEEAACRANRSCPRNPDSFNRLLKEKKFTNGADAKVVSHLYKTSFDEVVLGVTVLDCSEFGWGRAEAEMLIEALPHYQFLEVLYLMGNPTLSSEDPDVFLRLVGVLPKSLVVLKVDETGLNEASRCALEKWGSGVATGAQIRQLKICPSSVLTKVPKPNSSETTDKEEQLSTEAMSLCEMGFDEALVRSVWQAHNCDFDAALGALLG